MHAIKEKPVVVNGQIVIRPIMVVALTYDHRLLDGREAVTFLGASHVLDSEALPDPQSESRNTSRTPDDCSSPRLCKGLWCGGWNESCIWGKCGPGSVSSAEMQHISYPANLLSWYWTRTRYPDRVAVLLLEQSVYVHGGHSGYILRVVEYLPPLIFRAGQPQASSQGRPKPKEASALSEWPTLLMRA